MDPVERLGCLLSGYVVLEVFGRAPHEVLNDAQHIRFFDIRYLDEHRIRLLISLAHFWELLPRIREAGCRLKLIEKGGIPFFWHRLRRRRGFVGGVAIFVLALYLLSSLVWFVDIRSRGPIPSTDISAVNQALKEMGVRKGRLKTSLSPSDIEKNILAAFPKLAWVGAGFEGSRLVVTIVEREAPPKEKSLEGPANIIATKGGVVEEILVLSGQAKVAAGDVVRPGQVLISGLFLPQDGNEEEDSEKDSPSEAILMVRARGIVKARTSYQVIGEAPFLIHELEPSGLSARYVTIKWGEREIVSWGLRDAPYQRYNSEHSKTSPQWGNIKLPVEIETETYREYHVVNRLLSHQEAMNLAISRAEKALGVKLAGIKPVAREVELLPSPSPALRVMVKWQAMEEIGKELPIRGDFLNPNIDTG